MIYVIFGLFLFWPILVAPGIPGGPGWLRDAGEAPPAPVTPRDGPGTSGAHLQHLLDTPAASRMTKSRRLPGSEIRENTEKLEK